MLFNSADFLIFLPIVFILYWFVTKGNLKFQNVLLLVASYYFYSCWDWRFLFLLVFSTLLDYTTGIKIQDAGSVKLKRFWLWLSIVVNLGFLLTFKYYNFFISSFAEALSGVGIQANYTTLNVILPVGISFYTFHGLSYIIDIYKDRIKAERNFIDYSLFVSFFPLLVAGPIERATHLLPQIVKPRKFEYAKAVDGLRQILWGLFKKVVVADNCAGFANQIFNNHTDYSGGTLILGAIFFTIQIYCDFSGYSDIALGTARLFGIELLRNFAFPYFSRDIAEFWRRWHISLSSWFRDYVYIPLGGSRGGKMMQIRNTMIIFLLSGFWHGANWTFIVWGGLHAIYFLPLLIRNKNRQNMEIVAQGKQIPSFKETRGILTTFALVAFALIFFRATSLTHAFDYIFGMFSLQAGKGLEINMLFFTTVFFTLILFITEWINREKKFALEVSDAGSLQITFLRRAVYVMLVFAIFIYGGENQEFIYFQF